MASLLVFGGIMLTICICLVANRANLTEVWPFFAQFLTLTGATAAALGFAVLFASFAALFWILEYSQKD